jgi:hypothetical protein
MPATLLYAAAVLVTDAARSADKLPVKLLDIAASLILPGITEA